MGKKFEEMGVLKDAKDIFFLTQEEISEYIDGRSVTLNLDALAQIRKKEYYEFGESYIHRKSMFSYN